MKLEPLLKLQAILIKPIINIEYCENLVLPAKWFLSCVIELYKISNAQILVTKK